MIFLPDTNVCITYLRKKHAGIMGRFRATAPNEIAICDIVAAELWYGAHRGGQFGANEPILRAFLAPFPQLPFDRGSAEVYGNIRRVIELAGAPIGPHDLQIASIALSNDLTLVTHNTREFNRVPGLRVEDWEI